MPTRQKYDDCEYDGNRACAIEAFLDALGGRWKGMILFHLLPGTRRFGELRRLLPDISEKMLIQQLRELEADGLVHREVFHEVPPRVEYSETKLGASLNAALGPLADWGDRYAKRAKAAR